MARCKTVISSIAVEASWLCKDPRSIYRTPFSPYFPVVVWVLWLTCAAYAAWCSQTQAVNFVRCQTSSGERFPPPLPWCVKLTSRQAQCLEYEFLEICSFMNWIIGTPVTTLLQKRSKLTAGAVS